MFRSPGGSSAPFVAAALAAEGQDKPLSDIGGQGCVVAKEQRYDVRQRCAI